VKRSQSAHRNRRRRQAGICRAALLAIIGVKTGGAAGVATLYQQKLSGVILASRAGGRQALARKQHGSNGRRSSASAWAGNKQFIGI